MSNYGINRESDTIGSVDIKGFLAAQYLADYGYGEKDSDQTGDRNRAPIYIGIATPATFDHCRTLILGEYQQERIRFEASITQFYGELLASQEALGNAFDKVLLENLWNLYET